MRPLRMAIRGLRSYRHSVEVDFTGRDLVAIIGDTGAGKSSILEAITYALYNASTWDAARVKDLISDGAQTMSVELDFQADGRMYRVFRSTSRKSSPPSVHRLECLSDAKAARLDSEAQVSEEIVRLVGLSHKAFISAVILPQGHFQNLLHATPAEQGKILEGIFRLETIREVETRAKTLLVCADPLVSRLEGARSALPEDPAAKAREAGERRDHAAKTERDLLKAQKDVRAHEESIRAAGKRLQELSGPADRLVQASADGRASLTALAPLEREIAKAGSMLAEERKTVEARLKAAAEKIAAHERAGESRTALYEMRGLLDRVAADLKERVEEVRARLVKDGKALKQRAAAFEKAGAGLKKQDEAAVAARAALETAAERCEKEAEKEKEAGRLLGDYRRLQLDLTAREKAVKAAGDEKSKLIRALEAAVDAEKKGTSSVSERRTRLDEIGRANAAAHAAHGLAEGDACPVCSRKLPRGFSPPAAEDHDEALKELKEAEQALANASAASAEARGALAGAEARAQHAMEQLNAAKESAADILGRIKTIVPGINPEKTDAVILKPLRDGVENLRKEVTDLRAAADGATGEVHEARAAWKAGRESLEGDQERHVRETRDADAVEKRCTDQLSALPPFLGTAWLPTSAGVQDLSIVLEKRLQEVEALHGDETRIQSELTALARKIDALKERRETEVDLPRRKAVQALETLATRLNDALEALHRKPLARPAELEDMSILEQWSGELEAARKEVTAELLREMEAAETGRNKAAQAIAGILEAHGFSDGEKLDKARVEAAGDRRSAEREVEEAERQIPEAADLDRRLVIGRELVAGLRDLGGLLSQTKFIHHVIQRRQKNLLAVASGILSSMTADRYGFSADFQVIDKISNQPRSTKTLSGGESFLASLALALGLVEIAGRAGGRLDALFLDEGFGALDANALDEALTALETRAKAGKLVAVVSHLKAVAERIDTVLLVKRTASGSVVRWADARERDDLLDEELEAGLLT